MKNSSLRVRIDAPLHKAFLDACKKEDRTASQEIRKFMRRFIEEREQILQTSLFSDQSAASFPSDRLDKK
jgi:antitoxin component of RelBE/YafQ-DinJ toxin-antitoxin module